MPSSRTIPQDDLVVFLDDVEDLDLPVGEDPAIYSMRFLRAGEPRLGGPHVRVGLEVGRKVLIEIVQAVFVPRSLNLSQGLLVRCSHQDTSPFHGEPTPVLNAITRMEHEEASSCSHLELRRIER